MPHIVLSDLRSGYFTRRLLKGVANESNDVSSETQLSIKYHTLQAKPQSNAPPEFPHYVVKYRYHEYFFTRIRRLPHEICWPSAPCSICSLKIETWFRRWGLPVRRWYFENMRIGWVWAHLEIYFGYDLNRRPVTEEDESLKYDNTKIRQVVYNGFIKDI